MRRLFDPLAPGEHLIRDEHGEPVSATLLEHTFRDASDGMPLSMLRSRLLREHPGPFAPACPK